MVIAYSLGKPRPSVVLEVLDNHVVLVVGGSTRPPFDEPGLTVKLGSLDARLMNLSRDTHFFARGLATAHRSEVEPRGGACRFKWLLDLTSLVQERARQVRAEYLKAAQSTRPAEALHQGDLRTEGNQRG
ncbi:MAG: hypothetical protein U1A78_33660 [Polyangia bacterium]